VRDAVLRYVAIGLGADVLISLLGVWLFRRAGEAEAIRDAKDQTRIAAQGSVEPVLSNALLRGSPRALDAVDRVVQERVLSDDSIGRSIAHRGCPRAGPGRNETSVLGLCGREYCSLQEAEDAPACSFAAGWESPSGRRS
jgi:hypothetical protein